MAVIVVMEWEGATPAQYEAVRADIDWVTNQPPGALLHACSYTEQGLKIVDIWDRPDQFQAFVESTLTPSVTKIGIVGQPKVVVTEAAYVDVLGLKT